MQLAASADDHAFCQYVLPDRSVHPQAQQVTGLSVDVQAGKRVLRKDGKVVVTKSLDATCSDFLVWLKTISPNPVVLVAHNCLMLDAKVIANQFSKAEQLEQLSQKVAGFADTLPAFKKAIPGRKSYSLPSLMADFVPGTFDAATMPLLT